MGRGLKLLLALAAVLVVAIVAFSVGAPANCETDNSSGTRDGGSLSQTGTDEIPTKAREMYVAMAKRWNIDVAFLASIGKQECDHGRCAYLSQINYAGCVGWMQLGVGGRCGHYWNRNKCDGNKDGRMDVLDPWDNICASAKGLRNEKGAPPTGGSEAGYRRAACNYYGACADRSANYADEVMARAKAYGFPASPRTTTLASTGRTASDQDTDTEPHDPNGADVPAGCPGLDGDPSVQLAAFDGPDKPFDLLPNANRPGVGLSTQMVTVTRKIAGLLPQRLKVCTGTSHNRLSSSGNVSDHWAGNGIDLCSSANGFPATGGGYGNTIATAALIVAGKNHTDAARMARQGGAFTLHHQGIRFQIIWKSQVGGNHDDHIHVGIDPSSGQAA